MNKTEVETYVASLKQKWNVRIYSPYKYFKGLKTKKEIRSRLEDMMKKEYRPFKTDTNKKTRVSTYTKTFQQRYKIRNTSLKQKSMITGVPYDILLKVFNKGKAAWRTGHRVGATEDQWGYARVHSFLVKGCTLFGPDFHLFEEALSRMSLQKRKQWLSYPIECPKHTLQSPFFKKRNTYHRYMYLKRHYQK